MPAGMAERDRAIAEITRTLYTFWRSFWSEYFTPASAQALLFYTDPFGYQSEISEERGDMTCNICGGSDRGLVLLRSRRFPSGLIGCPVGGRASHRINLRPC
jgi:hypothetical protein